MRDKLVFITGSARGLGAGLAKKVVQDGGKVWIVDLDGDSVQSKVKELGRNSGGCAGNVTDLKQMELALKECASHFGRIDAVVANAGILRMSSIEHMDPADFHAIMNVNVTGVFNTIRASIPYLRDSKGYLQVVSSLAAAIHVPLMSHYAASKAAVEALADVARQELAADGIDVGCVHPTFAKTDMIKENDTGVLWGGHHGLFGAVEPDLVIDAMYKGLKKRSRKIIAPKAISPLVIAPGLFHTTMEMLSKASGAEKALADFKANERKTHK